MPPRLAHHRVVGHLARLRRRRARRLRERAVATQVDPSRRRPPAAAARAATAHHGHHGRRRALRGPLRSTTQRGGSARSTGAIEWPRRAVCGTRAAVRRLERSTVTRVITTTPGLNSDARPRTRAHAGQDARRAGAPRNFRSRRTRRTPRDATDAGRRRRAIVLRDVEPAAALWAAGRPAQGGRGAQHDRTSSPPSASAA